MLDETFAPSLRLRLPSALLTVWSTDRVWLEELATSDPGIPGLFPVEPGLFAVIPQAADAEVIETAYSLGRQLLTAAPNASRARALVFPGEIILDEHQATVTDSPLLQDLAQSAPELDEPAVYLTGHATHELESGWSLAPCGNYRGPSGRELPLYRLDRPAQRPPWRNDELFGRRPPHVPRAKVDSALREVAGEAAVVVSGPLGCGKSRAIAETFGNGARSICLQPWSLRSGGPSLTQQLCWALRSEGATVADPRHPRTELPLPGPEQSWWRAPRDELEQLDVEVDALLERQRGALRLVVDGIHRADRRELETVSKLLGKAAVGGLQTVIVGRSGGRWRELFQDLPHIEIGPLEQTEMGFVCENLLSGLSIPDELRDGFLEVSGGFPFALEEGLLQLVRRKVLRRVYGNFFFSGTPEVHLEPSPRLTRHVEAELRRLADPLPLRIVAGVDASIPIDELNGATSLVGGSYRRNWETVPIQAGLVQRIGVAGLSRLAFTCPLHRESVASTIDPAAIGPLRHLVGLQLAELPVDPEELWETYRLLAGTPDAIPLLIKVARRSDSHIPKETLFLALTEELESHRERLGDPGQEFELLWVLLPLARRLGRLNHLDSAIERAIELAGENSDRLIALTALKADKEQNEGSYREAERTLQRGLAWAQNSDERRKALLVVQLGKVLQRQDRHPEARKLYEEILPLLDRAGNRSLAAACRYHLGNVAMQEKRLEVALRYHQEALNERRELQLNSQIGPSLTAMGTIYLALGDYPRSLSYYREAEGVLRAHGHDGEVSWALTGIGRALSRLGDFTAATTPFRQALDLRASRDDVTGEAISRLLVATNHLHLGRSEFALEDARKAHFQLSLVDNSKQLGDAEQVLGRVRLKQRQYEDARQHLENAILCHQQHGDVLSATFDRSWLLETSIAVSDHRRIEELCAAIEAVLETLRYPELGETLDLRLYQGLEWMRQRGRDVDPMHPLLRAYRELYRKTELLSAELRNPFLFQVPDNRAIINAATLHGLSLEPTDGS